MKPTVIDNPWQALRRHTGARIALGRAGVSMPTAPQLALQLAHAKARDAVHHALEVEALRTALGLPFAAGGLDQDSLLLSSAAASRDIYLQRPDLGRRLSPQSRSALQAHAPQGTGYDVALVIADGLSAIAIERNAVALLRMLLPPLADEQWTIAPLCIVTQGRVAVGDEVGELLNARCVVILIGERPGLSSPDSLGAYLTWSPHIGCTDESRNCISNIRPDGLGYQEAAEGLRYLLTESRRRRYSGVLLKDETPPAAIATPASKLPPAL